MYLKKNLTSKKIKKKEGYGKQTAKKKKQQQKKTKQKPQESPRKKIL